VLVAGHMGNYVGAVAMPQHHTMDPYCKSSFLYYKRVRQWRTLYTWAGANATRPTFYNCITQMDLIPTVYLHKLHAGVPAPTRGRPRHKPPPQRDTTKAVTKATTKS
jgi:hypothetical protein